jgi:hypothetical protein
MNPRKRRGSSSMLSQPLNTLTSFFFLEARERLQGQLEIA